MRAIPIIGFYCLGLATAHAQYYSPYSTPSRNAPPPSGAYSSPSSAAANTPQGSFAPGNYASPYSSSSGNAPYGNVPAPYGTGTNPYGSTASPYGSTNSPYGITTRPNPYGSASTPPNPPTGQATGRSNATATNQAAQPTLGTLDSKPSTDPYSVDGAASLFSKFGDKYMTDSITNPYGPGSPYRPNLPGTGR